MNQARILCPTDFSSHSAVALQHAAIYARALGATVVIVHVEEVVDPSSGEGMLHSGVRPPETSQALLRRLESVVPDDDVECEHRLVQGKPAEEILRIADAEGVGMIVMGTHGRTGLGRMLLGSVAEQVLRKAKCTILTIKNAV